jgi:hypothetical protein
MEQLLFEQLNQIDIVDFLAAIDIHPVKSQGYKFFYLSPLPGQPSTRPTFIVDRQFNRWRETTTNQSGKLVDFGVRYYDCTIRELREKLLAAVPRVPHGALSNEAPEAINLSIEQSHPIRSASLIQYLWERRIALDVARNYCSEVYYTRDKKPYCALGFRNDIGGYELYHQRLHHRVAPYGPTHITRQKTDIIVFREVFDLLTFATIFTGPIQEFPDLLVLNSPLSFDTVKPLTASYRNKHFFLPNDAAGNEFSNLAKTTHSGCHDHRSVYAGYPTLNDWTCRIGTGSYTSRSIPRIDAS